MKQATKSTARVITCYLAALAIVLGGAVAWVYNDTRMRCEEKLLGEALSPDGAWKAAQYEDYCQGFLVTTVAVVVRLVSTSNPDKSASILADSAYSDDERPRVAWTADRTLQVDAQSSLFLNVITCEFEGVRVHVRFPPEDADRRAAWYHQLGKPDPDPGGERA